MRWGVDDLLTYHYLAAELFRAAGPSLTPAEYYARPKRDRADLVWRHLFVDRPPLSEACRGVLTAVAALGLDPSDPTPDGWRAWFAQQRPADHVDRVFAVANVSRVTMTNDPFDDAERHRWLAGVERDARFDAVVRLDPVLLDWPTAAGRLASWGYATTSPHPSPRCLGEVRRFLHDWADRTAAVYLAVSLPPTWRYPVSDAATAVLEGAVLAVAAERGLPLALMIGARRGVHPALLDAGDGVGPTDVPSVERLAAAFGGVRFLVTTLAREDQHAVVVAARKFANLMPFGCWWFLNTPGLIAETTRTRLELLGPTFVAQHSDARVLEQLIYKWHHSRTAIAAVLAEQFALLAATGRAVTGDEIATAVRLLLADNYGGFRRPS